MGSEKREKTMQEKGWSRSVVPKDRSTGWEEYGATVGKTVDMNRELKRREDERAQTLQLSLSLEEREWKEMEMERKVGKNKISESRKTKRLAENLAWRGEHEKRGVKEGGIMDFFAPEHLVAASNDQYTAVQVKAIYGESIVDSN